MNEKYLEVSEMGVDVDTKTKRLKVTEFPPKEDETDKRKRLINELTTEIMTRFPSPNVGDAVSSVMQLVQCSNRIDTYESWKLLAMYMAGKLSVYESGNKKGCDF